MDKFDKAMVALVFIIILFAETAVNAVYPLDREAEAAAYQDHINRESME